jgi:hypothetical protein
MTMIDNDTQLQTSHYQCLTLLPADFYVASKSAIDRVCLPRRNTIKNCYVPGSGLRR